MKRQRMNITLKNFAQYVPAKIWQRGVDYYMSGAVTDLDETSPGEWTATVEGTEIYMVEISLNGENVNSWDCDCPYDGGDICKHVVAAILAICDERKKVTKSVFSEMKIKADDAETVKETLQNDDFADLMKIAKEEDIRYFVIDYASKHKEVKTALSDYLKKKYIQPSAIEKDYKKEVEDIFRPAYKRKSRYSRYDDDFELLDWEKVGVKMGALLEKAELLLKAGNVNATLCIALQFFRSLDDNYHKLKGWVPSYDWKDFLEEMLTHVNHALGYGSNIVGDIYVEEKDYDKLFHLISSADSSYCLRAIMDYAHRLPESYASSLLSLFATELKVFAEVNMGRNYYAEVARMLHSMKKLKGGKEVVKALADEFRMKYKRRPAMIDELKGV